ncbi:MAG: glycosyltransferase [Rhizobiaceae bacterium]|nr:glycosyltransferase [Rhizobiaceae bacterium]
MMHAPSSAADTLVSIIIPVFNGARWLGDAIDSAIGQTHLNIEVIVVDDGSNDDGRTRAVAESYGDQIRLITKPNGGVASALNAGIQAMRGAFFSWLSHDDLYHPRKIEVQLARALSFPEPVVVFGDVAVIDEASRKVWELALGANTRARDHALWHVLEARLSGCSLLVPRVCFEICGVFDESLPTTQDYELWYRLARKYRFVHSSGLLTLSRAHADQGSRNTRHLEEASLLWMDFLDRLPADVQSGMAMDELEFCARACRADILASYPGLPAFAHRRMVEARSKAKLTLVADVRYISAAFETLGRLAGMGYVAIDVVFVQHGTGDGAVVGKFDHVMRRVGSLVTVSADTTAAEVSAAVAVRADPDAVMIFLSGDSPNVLLDLETGLDRLFAREFDAMLRTEPEGRWLDGGILRAGALMEAIRRSAVRSDRALRSELEFCARVAVMPQKPAQSPVHMAAAGGSVIPDDDAARHVVDDAPTDTQSRDEAAADIESLEAPTASTTRERYVHQFPPPYLGRFEFLRVARKPFLKEKNVERLLSLVERLRTIGGGRMYRPAVWTTERLLGARGKIDRDWYRSAYKDVDATIDPVIHYLKQGWRENRDPSPSFSTSEYIRRFSGGDKLNPITHASFYLEKQKDRPILGSFLVTKLLRYPISKQFLSDKILASLSRMQSRRRFFLPEKHIGKIEWMFGVRGKIDRDWYRQTYLLSSGSGEDPSLHYLATGWRYGNKPSERYRIASFPTSGGPLSHLNPLSRDTFLGRTEIELIEDPSVSAAEVLSDFAEGETGGDREAVDSKDTLRSSGSNIQQERFSLQTDTHHPEAVFASAVLPACVAFVPDGTPSSADWIRYVRKSLGSQARSVVVLASGTSSISLSGVGPDVSFNLPEQLPAAVEHIRAIGVARFDLVGLAHQESIQMLLDGLSIPVDVTVLSEPIHKADRALLRRAERVLTPEADIALSLRQLRQRGRILHVVPPCEHEAFNYRVVRRRLQEADSLRILVIMPEASEPVISSVLDVAGMIAERNLPISLMVAAERERTCTLQSVIWVGQANFPNLIELIGETSPHLLWLATDPDTAMLPYAQHVAEMGLPVLLTGSRRVASRFFGRDFAWRGTDKSGGRAEAIIQQLEALRESGLDLPSTGLSPVKGSPVAFYPGRYLEWRKRP